MSLPQSKDVASCHFSRLTLELFSYLPGHVHAFYLEYIYYDRREQRREGLFAGREAPGVYSDRVQNGGHNYGTVAQPTV